MNVPRIDSPSERAVSCGRWSRWVCAGLLVVLAFSGCAACHPLEGVPAAYVPDEYLGPSRSGKKTIDLSLLVQRQPDQYRLAAGDILSVYVPGVLGSLQVVTEKGAVGETPPINLPQSPADPPTIGYPTTVRDDGTISLPLVPPINVHGLTLAEAEHAVRRAYTVHANILNDKRDRVLINLARRREYRVLVVRQETADELSTGVQPGTVNIGRSKRGTAKVVRLPAYENDVLHALAKAEGGADGLPGLDARNTIYIIRRKQAHADPSAGPSPVMDPDHDDASPSAAQPTNQSGAIAHPPNGGARLEPPASATGRPGGPLPDGRGSDGMPAAPPVAPPPPAAESSREPSAAGPFLEGRGSDGMPHSERSRPSPSTKELDEQPPEIPLWPRPAEPAESLRRTSSRGLPLWGHTTVPVFRGQSSTFHAAEVPEICRSSPVPFGHVGSGPLFSAASWNARDVGGHDQSWRSHLLQFDPTVENPTVTKIPVRLSPGEHPTFTEQDIILQDGDIVFIESRETEVFYTGGLLGGGQYTLPRDYDLGVLEAISVAQSPQIQQNQTTRSIGGISALNMDVTFSASHVVILRQLPNGTRMPIEVDLYKALRRPETENILIQPGDLILLQYTKLEAIGAFLERHLLEGALFGIAAAQFNNNGSGF